MGAVLAPSILSADFTRLGEQIREVEEGGAALLHVDVMDGHFVPNLSVGPAVTAAVCRVTDLPVDCHLMVEDPDRYVPAFIEAGAEMVSVHVEAARHLHRTLHAIREGGAKAGAVVNPATPLSALEEVLPIADFVLLMSVDPGFGGQGMIPEVLAKARRLREWIAREKLETRIELDGGVTVDRLEEIAAAGVDIVVAGSAVFGSGDARARTREMVDRLTALAVGADGR